jgi:hypothetical protein
MLVFFTKIIGLTDTKLSIFHFAATTKRQIVSEPPPVLKRRGGSFFNSLSWQPIERGIVLAGLSMYHFRYI